MKIQFYFHMFWLPIYTHWLIPAMAGSSFQSDRLKIYTKLWVTDHKMQKLPPSPVSLVLGAS